MEVLSTTSKAFNNEQCCPSPRKNSWSKTLDASKLGVADTFTTTLSGCYKSLVYLAEWDRILIGHRTSSKLSLWDAKSFKMIDSLRTFEKCHSCMSYSKKYSLAFSGGYGG